MNVLSRLLCVLAVGAVLAVPGTSIADDDDERASAGPVTVSEIGQGSARVSATVTLGDGATAYWFEYGPSSELGTRTPSATATSRDREDQVEVSHTLTGLSADTAYHVKLVVAGAGGRSSGAVATFTTAGAVTGDPPADPAPPSTPAPPADALPDAARGPELGASFVAVAEQGRVRVRLPATDRYVDLPGVASLPVGTIVDARAGTIALRTALPDGSEQRGAFWGSEFEVRQSAAGGGRTDVHLRGGSFAGCRRQARRTRTLASAAAAQPKPIRRLWAKDRSGRFRTHGRDSVTTVRGTAWSVADRCDGTLTKVSEGAVDVRVRRTGRVVRLDAGEAFLARHRR